ncbi:MAG TPA: glycoside hydrolase family 9 protein [Bryobacteraceae bacterium]|nr:glycoside hydrolase family 9 protein [Bryobacteraceae bacterium]
MSKVCKNAGVIVFAVTCIAKCLEAAPGAIALGEKEYFEAPGFAFLVYHNAGSLTRGGLQMMQNGEWLLASDDLQVTGRDSSTRLSARIVRRVVDRERKTATIIGEVSGLGLGYQLICRTDGDRMFVTVKFDRPLDASKIRQASFRMSLYPPAYFMKSFQGDSMTGMFPRQYSGRRTLLKSTRVLRLAQEDPSHTLMFERRDGVLELGDERGNHPTGWFSVTAAIEPGSSDTGMELEIRPSIDPQWRRPPVIGISQVGYHPKQPKRAVLELDPRDAAGGSVNLFKLSLTGDRQLVKSGAAKPWGPFLNYRYAIFDFTDVLSTGAYVIEYRGQTAGPFRIDPQVYDEAWQPTLEVFLPVQMCHVAVRDRNRFWHGACHLDDALQAPAGHRHIDGYQQGERETKFADYEHIPGLSWGGWHDAGDYDLPAGSISNTTLALALAQEEFKPGIDLTTVRRATREVLLHVPDGEEDLLQQVEYGVEGLLGSFRASGHIFPGIIENSQPQYDVTGDPVNITDNHIYDSSLKPDQVSGERSGKPDDRWAFTNRNTGLEYRVAQTLAAASRVLRPKKVALADECLAAARKLWEYEQTNPPVYAPSAYVGRGGSFPGDEIAATAELWLTTDDPQYQKRLYALMPQIRSTPAEQVGRGPGWTLVRLLPKVSDPEYRNLVLEIAKKWRAAADAVEAANPYGVRFPSFVSRSDWKLDSPEQARGNSIMGFGWDLQSDAMRDYFYHKNLPEIFGADTLLNVVNFVLGCHPASNTSYVSGVGANSQLIAYGFNRDDYSYIPGGVISGASFMRPGFMDLKNFPYYFNQTEYVIHGAGSYIFDVLAAQWMLQHQPAAK